MGPVQQQIVVIEHVLRLLLADVGVEELFSSSSHWADRGKVLLSTSLRRSPLLTVRE
jgi:hypothetical protein